MSAGFTDATQWNQKSTSASGAVSRNAQRADVTKAKSAAAAKSKARVAAAEKAKTERQGKARQVALTALKSQGTDLDGLARTADASEVKTSTDSGDATPAVEKSAERTSTPAQARSARGSQDRVQPTRVSRSSDRSSDTGRSSGYTRAQASSSDEAQAPTSSSGWVRPLSGGTFTSGFGARWGRLHAGSDFATPVGTNLRAMNNATVVSTGWYGGQGQRVVLQFANGVQAVYAHMSSIAVSPGQSVSAGQSIGLSGNTGNSTGPHLHLEIHIGGSPVNPAGWLAARGLL